MGRALREAAAEGNKFLILCGEDREREESQRVSVQREAEKTVWKRGRREAEA